MLLQIHDELIFECSKKDENESSENEKSDSENEEKDENESENIRQYNIDKNKKTVKGQKYF